MTNKNKLNWKEIQKSLLSKDDKIFNAALKKLEKHGENIFLYDIIEIIHKTSNENRIESLFSFLSRLKNPGAEKNMMEIIKDKKNEKIKARLLNSFWNSSLDYTAYFSDFVEFAVHGNYMIALECLTILENLKGPFEEKQLLDSQLSLKVHIENKGKNDEKAPLISEIAVFIKNTNQGLSDINQDLYNS